jgi:vacuolar-type H+-ATPase subunit C/Vma6
MLLQHLLNIYPCCSIATLAVAQNMRELYRLVLVDTPLAPYFSECITSEVSSL